MGIASATSINLQPGGVVNCIQSITAGGLIGGLIQVALIVAAVIFFFMLVIGGVRWIASGGDKGQTEAARNQITAALVGLVIVFAAWAIANLVGNLFGITIFTPGGFKLPGFTG